MLALIVSVSVMGGRLATQIAGRDSCAGPPAHVRVAVSTDIAPVVGQVAKFFNAQRRLIDGHCATVEIMPVAPMKAASDLDGQRSGASLAPIDAWIPDSSLWVQQVRSFAVGAREIQTNGRSIARSPLLLVMPAAAASRTSAFTQHNWRLLLPPSAGGPSAPPRFRVELPNPAHSAAGLSALIEVSRLLGADATGRSRFDRFAATLYVTPYFGAPATLARFVRQGNPPANENPITVTTEQAVLAYDRAHPHSPLAACYPTGRGAAFGSPEMNYPYVLTTTRKARRSAAAAFEHVLLGHYAQALIRYAGFRSADNVPDAFPSYSGLRGQTLQRAQPTQPAEVPVALAVWRSQAVKMHHLPASTEAGTQP